MRAIFGVKIDTDDDARRATRLWRTRSVVQNVLLTMWQPRFVPTSPTARTSGTRSASSTLSSSVSVCAGDCTLAAFLLKWYKDRDNVEEAMKLALATGANVAESVGLGDFAACGRVQQAHYRPQARPSCKRKPSAGAPMHARRRRYAAGARCGEIELRLRAAAANDPRHPHRQPPAAIDYNISCDGLASAQHVTRTRDAGVQPDLFFI